MSSISSATSVDRTSPAPSTAATSTSASPTLFISAKDFAYPPTRATSPTTHPKDRLTTLPPELFLQVISHLPSSSSLLPLSQISTYFQQFILLTHASAICNTLITTHHFHASQILGAKLDASGWLLPTHPCVLDAEKRILRDQVLQAGCTCISCRDFIRASRSSASNRKSVDDVKRSFTCLPSTPSRGRAPTPASKLKREPARECTSEHLFSSPWKLTMPGPLFLVFLQRHEWEIEIRHAMLPRASAPSRLKGGAEGEDGEEQRRFNFFIGHYSIRRFLADVEREFASTSTSLPSSTHNDNEPSASKPSFRTRISHAWQKSRLGLGTSTVGRCEADTARARSKKEKRKAQTAKTDGSTTRPMFGEITPSPASPSFASASASASAPGEWIRGLLWFYGVQTPLSSPPPASDTFPSTVSTSRLGGEAEAEEQKTVKNHKGKEKEERLPGQLKLESATKARARSCMAGLRHGAQGAGRKLQQRAGAWIGLRGVFARGGGLAGWLAR
ncbi:uncharacterized protein L3040_001410 [Drepanopeziza brunnea f. sp. 'multigermtubi']|uniref:F-box domain-containing protein n=1 Tax=Marssonina brunnea f. sp. multigermtubi (strain MB_m1) TaxID=1072389 RepID=K1WUI1_MARBU|nr:uncharacterized protein MBM_05140 [Drepanopeziza brunnea f. sp. 'multigermtubi' MB_m1]EKD16671.1 hypothetical protein MBM_05140 [Drepanopeziza brunnea f. sp. 'multigermtubi' MB_m1]KAJ5051635.1 hypothetical protein L3040_001410 [Drepanopeziza brunnea f. sp. 'multigermtubi']